eukprot:sb/3472991/
MMCRPDGDEKDTQAFAFAVESEVREDTRDEVDVAVCDVDGVIYYAGDSFTAPDGCNTCMCTETGAAACTLMMCAPDNEAFAFADDTEDSEGGDESDSEDTEREDTKDEREASTVNCVSGGRSYYPGDSFTAEDGCNNCVCTKMGAAACTRKACPRTCT